MEDGDDDFGDLYADVEVEASSVMNTAPQFSQLQLVSSETGKQNSVLEVSSDKEDRASDSVDGDGDDDDDDEDDLNIVLNSDDDNIGHGEGFTVARSNTNLWSGELEDEDDDDLGRDELVGGKSGGKAGSGGDGINQGLIGGGKGVHNSHSQYKYVRSQSAVYASDLKGNGCGAAAYSSREDNVYCQRMGSRSKGPQSGQRFSLPRSRTILDVNIDIFEQKPWKHAGADITDYFNYGLNEDSWKLYCNQVDEYRHRGPTSSGIPVSEPAQLMEAYDGGFKHEMVAREVWGKCESRHVEIASSMWRMPSREQQPERRKGRAIQVEDSIVERQSSMDVMRQLNRDSDVIQITVQDPGEHCSGCVKEGLGHLGSSAPEASNLGDISGDDSTDHLSFSSASEDESIEGNHQGMEILAPKRSSNRRSSSMPVTNGSENHEIHQISEVDGHQYSRMAICGSEGTDEAIRTSDNTKERVGEDTCTTDPSMSGAESSEAEKSPASHCKAFEDCACIDRRKSYSHEIRPSTKSFTESIPSVKSGYHHSEDSRRLDDKRKHGDHRYHARQSSPIYNNRNHEDSKPTRNGENDDSYSRRLNDKRKPGDHRYHARHNSPVYNNRTHGGSKLKPYHGNDDSCSRRPDDKRQPGERRYHARHSSPVYNNRTHGVSKRKAHHENDDSFPMSDTEVTYDVHSTVGHNRRNERLHAFDPYDEENISYSKESELPSDYHGERFSGNEDWDTSARDLRRKSYERFGAKMDPFVFRSSKEEEYDGKRRRYIEDDKVMSRDWCPNERELAVANVDFFTHQEFGWQNSEYPPYMKYKRGAQWKRRGDNLNFRNKGEDDEFFLEHKYVDDIQGGKIRRSLTYNGRERDHFERGYVKHVAYTRWEFRGPGRNKRRFGSPSVGLNNLLLKGDGDRYLRYREDHSFASRSSEEPLMNNSRWHGNMMPRNNLYRRRGRCRGQWTERFRDDGSLDRYSEPFDREDYTIDIDDRVDMGRTTHHWQSEMQWDEDEIMSRHEDAKFCAEGALFPFEKVSRRKMFASEHGADHVEELIDDPHVEGRKYRPRREGTSSDKFERTSNVLCGRNREQPFRGSGDSLYSHLVDGSNHVEELIDDLHAKGCRYEQTREVKSGNKFGGTSNVTHGGSHEWSSMGRLDSLDSHLVDGSDHVEELIDVPHAEGYGYKQTRKVVSGNKCSRTSNVIHGESHEQPSLSCRNSLDSHLVVGEEKSSEKHDNAEWNIDESQKQKHTWMDFDSCPSDKGAQAVQTNGVDEGLDIEEGQILTEELNMEPMKDDAGVQVNDVNKLHNQTGKMVFDNPRILEAMEKMEKRRARFKEPITTTRRDSDSTAMLKAVDSVQEMASTKQQRPARKRRWGGS